MHYHNDHKPVDYRENDLSADLCGCDELEAVRNLGVEVLSQLLGHGAEYFHRAEGRDKRGQLAVGHKSAVERAEHVAGGDDDGACNGICGRAGDAHSGKKSVRRLDKVHEDSAERAEH